MNSNVAEAFVSFGAVGMDKVNSALKSVQSGLGSVLGTIGKIAGPLALAGGLYEVIKKAMEAEERMHGLKTALAVSGQEVEKNTESFKKLADGMQRATNQSKADTSAMLLQAVHYGKSAKEAEQFTVIASGLSKRLGISGEEAMSQLLKMSSGLRNSLEKTVPDIARCTTQEEKLAAASKLGASGLQEQFAATETTKGGFTSLGQALNSIATSLGDMLLPAINFCVDKFTIFVGWIQRGIEIWKELVGEYMSGFSWIGDAIGTTGDSFGWLGDFASSCLETVGGWIKWLINQIFKIPIILKFVYNNFGSVCAQIWEDIKTLGKNIVITVQWFCQNWKDIMFTVFDYVTTAMINIGKNIRALWNGIMGFISGKGWHCDFTPITEGFKNTIKRFPEYVKAQQMIPQDKLDQLWKDLAASDAVDHVGRAIAKTAKPTIETVKKGLLDIANQGVHASENIKASKEKAKKEGGSMTDIGSLWKNMVSNLMKSKEEKIASENLAVNKQILTVNKQQLAQQRTSKPEVAMEW